MTDSKIKESLEGLRPVESEIQEYGLSENDVKHFFELINISRDDFEIVYNQDDKGKSSVYVKFPEFTAQHVELIMKVALKQLRGRILRQIEWAKYHGEPK